MYEHVDLFIIDDDEDVLELLATVLTKQGIVLETFPDALEALSALDYMDCRVLLTDLQLPEMTGDELAAEVSAYDPDVTLLAMTCDYAYGEKVGALFDRVFNKPFILSEVLACVESALKVKEEIEPALDLDDSME